MKVLVTGSSGFVGAAIVNKLHELNINYLASARTLQVKDSSKNLILAPPLSGDWRGILSQVDVVIHAAALAHISIKDNSRSLSIFRKINTDATLNIAQQAASSGVKRFVFISTIGVNGSTSHQPFTESDPVQPHNDYALSKLEAEKGLNALAEYNDLEVAIIRPPLVYGPNPPGNFASLLALVKKGYPLPFSSVINNKRSLIALDNLVDFILLCADYEKSPQAANQTFVISDGDDISTAALIQRISSAYGIKHHLFPFPVKLQCLLAQLLDKEVLIDRLFSSLQIDSSKARKLLDWQPIITMGEQLSKMAESEGYPR